MMDILEACQAIEDCRGDSILVATMGAMGAFDQLEVGQPRLSSVPLMGGAASLGLGLALGQPERPVVVVDGDASLLMQLGVLATVAENRPVRFFHFVIHNGTQFSGFSNLAIAAERQVDFVGLAKAAGYLEAVRFSDSTAMEQALPALFELSGPVLIELIVEPGDEKPGVPTVFEIPDRQFERMGMEATALSTWIKDHAGG